MGMCQITKQEDDVVWGGQRQVGRVTSLAPEQAAVLSPYGSCNNYDLYYIGNKSTLFKIYS